MFMRILVYYFHSFVMSLPSISLLFSFFCNVFAEYFGYAGPIKEVGKCSLLFYFLKDLMYKWYYLFPECLLKFTREVFWA